MTMTGTTEIMIVAAMDMASIVTIVTIITIMTVTGTTIDRRLDLNFGLLKTRHNANAFTEVKMYWKPMGYLIIPLLASGCAGYGGDGGYDGYSSYGNGPATSYSPAASDEHDSYDRQHRESSRVINGSDGTTYVFHESNGDTDIVHPDGSVTTVTHDPDGTRTIVGPNGVQVEPEHHHHDDDDDDD